MYGKVHIDFMAESEEMSMTRRSKRLQDRQNRQQVTNEVQRQQSTMNSGKKRPRMTSKVTSGEDSDWETPKKQVMVSPRHNRQTRYATRRAAMTNMRESITDLHDQSLSNSPARPSATNRIKSTRSASNEPNRQCTTRQLRQRTTRQLSMEGNDTEPSEQFKNLYERVKKRVRRVPRDCYHVSRYEEAQRQNRYNPFASILRNRRTSIPKRRRRSRGCLSWMSPSSTESEEEDSGKEFYEKEACPSKPKVIRTKRATKCTSRDPAPTLFAGDQMNTDFEKIKLDKRITFESVGGHETSIRILKEMIVFPLMYENLFSKFKIRPPRGVLFHGPPGTGKTLLARALANECASGTRKVAFFMRKGADCLSKWVGESERQLKILFEKAYEMRPSIIFFDEIDGLAPVRSSRQDQIHTSVVSTLLALMDGVDSDSGVIIIGATNRLDFIDPALRRPGRFDREFFFGLPKFKVRADILHIHTKDWQRRPTEDQINDLAERTNGFCGADLQALCRDSVLYALRRTYPQVYKTKRRLNIDPDTIHVIQEDFNLVLSIMNSSVARTATMYSLPVPNDLKCLIQSKTYTLCNIITELFPAIVNSSANKNQFSITSHKARVLIAGNPTCGVSTYIAPAILHMLETNVYAIDPLVLYSPAWRSAEEAIANQFRLASQNVPSVIYFPRIESWWSNLGESAQVMLLNALNTLDPRAAVLLVVASDCALEVIPSVIRDLFDQSKSTFLIADPDYSQYSEFISTIFIKEIPSILNTVLAQEIDVIDNCDSEDEIQEKVLSPEELEELWQREEAVMISLRLFLREMLSRFVHDKRFTLFRSPVDPSKVIDYYDIIKQPIDLSLIMSKIDKHNYFTVDQFLADVKLLLRNANMYNPDAVLDDRDLRHKASYLYDFAVSTVKNELHVESHEEVKQIFQDRLARGAIQEIPIRYCLYRLIQYSETHQSPSNSLSSYSNQVFIRYQPVIPKDMNNEPLCVLREDEFNTQQVEPSDDNPIYKRILSIEPTDSKATCFFECVPRRTSCLANGNTCNHVETKMKLQSRNASCSPSRRRDTASGGGNLLNKSALKRLNDLAEKCISSTDSWNLDSLQRFKSRILSIVSRRHICNDPTDSILQAVANVANEFCEEVSSPVSGCAILDQ